MEFIISFFRDMVDGWWYVLYVLACLFFILVVVGIIGDKKRANIAARLKEKKTRDIASGKEARIAALESKQVLDVMEEDATSQTENISEGVSSNNTEDLAKKDDAPAVLVIGADGSSTAPNLESSLDTHQKMVQSAQEQQVMNEQQFAQSQQSTIDSNNNTSQS